MKSLSLIGMPMYKFRTDRNYVSILLPPAPTFTFSHSATPSGHCCISKLLLPYSTMNSGFVRANAVIELDTRKMMSLLTNRSILNNWDFTVSNNRACVLCQP
jgi:hypothetical protein